MVARYGRLGENQAMETRAVGKAAPDLAEVAVHLLGVNDDAGRLGQIDNPVARGGGRFDAAPVLLGNQTLYRT